ncbi:MAG: hypothetical protein ACRBBW_05715 [Cellvibrionaceae bacterium]
MISFGGKKAKKTPVKPAVSSAQATVPARQQLKLIARLIKAVKIGTRIRYHMEYEDSTVMESLVIGYQINGVKVYRHNDVQVLVGEDKIGVAIDTPDGVEEFSRVESFDLIVPGAVGEEKKLDYDSRASLSRRGPFAPHARLSVMSYCYNTEHLKFEAEVLRNLKLTEGVHTGLQVALLSVSMGTIGNHEPRKFSRVETRLCVTVSKNGTETVMTAELQDFSEETLRLELEQESDVWPKFGKKDFLLVGLKPSMDKPLLKLRCECVGERGEGRVFKMTHIMRHGKAEPFEMLDALEIKIDLMNLE